MPLHEAIRQILEENNKPMTTQEIANEINDKGLYEREDGKEITAEQIMLRVKQHSNFFNVTISLIR
jgi:repressor of nif and glnA expression